MEAIIGVYGFNNSYFDMLWTSKLDVEIALPAGEPDFPVPDLYHCRLLHNIVIKLHRLKRKVKQKHQVSKEGLSGAVRIPESL